MQEFAKTRVVVLLVLGPVALEAFLAQMESALCADPIFLVGYVC